MPEENCAAYVIKARDHMFPGSPLLFYYGRGPSLKHKGRMVRFFGPDANQAFIIEAPSDWCAEMVAKIIAEGLATPSIKPWAAKLLRPNNMEERV